MTSKKSLTLARDAKGKEAKKFLEALTTECIDMFENILPAAQKEPFWCEASVRNVFNKAKFIQENIKQIPSIYAQLIYTKISAIHKGRIYPYLRNGSYKSFNNVSERLDIAFEMNPNLGTEMKEIIHVYYVQLFGEEAFQRSRFYCKLFIKSYKDTFSIITRESSPLVAMELQANLQVSLAKGGDRDDAIRSILESITYKEFDLADSAFARTVIILILGNPDCDFLPEIISKLENELRMKSGVWDHELADLYLVQMNSSVLHRAIENTENKSYPGFLQLFLEYIDSFASRAKLSFKVLSLEARVMNQFESKQKSLTKKWTVPESEFSFKFWKDLLKKTTHGILRNGRNAVEEQLRLIRQQTFNFNKEFWRDLLE